MKYLPLSCDKPTQIIESWNCDGSSQPFNLMLTVSAFLSRISPLRGDNISIYMNVVMMIMIDDDDYDDNDDDNDISDD